MSGASMAHNLITMNTANGLYNQLVERGCRVFTSDMRVGINAGESYFYPNISVVCEKPRFEDSEFDTLINPLYRINVSRLAKCAVRKPHLPLEKDKLR